MEDGARGSENSAQETSRRFETKRIGQVAIARQHVEGGAELANGSHKIGVAGKTAFYGNHALERCAGRDLP